MQLKRSYSNKPTEKCIKQNQLVRDICKLLLEGFYEQDDNRCMAILKGTKNHGALQVRPVNSKPKYDWLYG